MRLRSLLPQLAVSFAISVATGHLWFLLLPLFGLASLINPVARISQGEIPREIAGRIWFGNRRLGRIPWLWPAAAREAVFLVALQPPASQRAALFQSELSKAACGPLIGISPSGKPVRLDSLEEFGHALILGVTGSGKTELLRLIMAQLQSDVWVADYKGGAGLTARECCQRATTNLDDNRKQFWEESLFELARREGQNSGLGAGSKLFLIIDELAAAVAEMEAQRAIDSIARKGRGLGMHLIAASQNLSGIPRSIWTNMQNRIMLAPADQADAFQLGIDSKQLSALASHQGILRTPDATDAFWFYPAAGQLNREPQPSIAPNPLLDFSGQIAQNPRDE
ncbi:MAG: hypothetical protein RL198_876 [Actinomycetota bacterium]|jgi:DNA helicase HerA-like ATPase